MTEACSFCQCRDLKGELISNGNAKSFYYIRKLLQVQQTLLTHSRVFEITASRLKLALKLKIEDEKSMAEMRHVRYACSNSSSLVV